MPFVELRRPPLRPNRVTYVMPCRGLGLLFNGRWTIGSRHRLLWRQHRDGRKKILCGGNVPGEKLVENKEEKKSRKERHTCPGAYPCIRSGKKAPSRLVPFVFYSILHFFLYLFFVFFFRHTWSARPLNLPIYEEGSRKAKLFTRVSGIGIRTRN